MSDGIIQVFLSSTFQEFRDEREAIFDAVDPEWFRFWMPEREGGGSGTNEERVAEALERSHAFFCLIGENFGSPHPADANRSIVQSELERAEELRREELLLDVLVYLKNELDTDAPATAEPKQKPFIQSIRDYSHGFAYDTFGSAAELVEKVRKSLDQLKKRYVQAYLHEFEASRDHRVARGSAFWVALVVAMSLSLFSGLLAVDMWTGALGLAVRLVEREPIVLTLALAGTAFAGGVALYASKGKRR